MTRRFDWRSLLPRYRSGGSAQFEGQRVGRDHVVADNDIVEILR